MSRGHIQISKIGSSLSSSSETTVSRTAFASKVSSQQESQIGLQNEPVVGVQLPETANTKQQSLRDDDHSSDSSSDVDFALPEGFEMPMRKNSQGHLVAVRWSSITTIDGTRRVSTTSPEGQDAVRENNRRLTEAQIELHNDKASTVGGSSPVATPAFNHGNVITVGSPIATDSPKHVTFEPGAARASQPGILADCRSIPRTERTLQLEAEPQSPFEHGRTIDIAAGVPSPVRESFQRTTADAKTPLSPAWSSDSDNRLIKAVTAGKKLNTIRGEFPDKTLADVSKRRKQLADNGSLVLEQLSRETPAEDESFHVPVPITKALCSWSSAEDDIVVVGVRAEETQAQISSRLNGRSPQAVKNRLYRLVELGKITEEQRQKVMNAAYGSDYVVGSKWSATEDVIVRDSLRMGKTAAETASGLINRTEGAVTRRRGALVTMGQLEKSEVFVTPGISVRVSSLRAKQSKGVSRWMPAEDALLRSLMAQSDERSTIFSHFPRRTESGVRNRWLRIGGIEGVSETGDSAVTSGKLLPSAAPADPIELSAGSVSLTTKAAPKWTKEEDDKLIECVDLGMSWKQMEGHIGKRNMGAFSKRWSALIRAGKVAALMSDSSTAYSGDDAITTTTKHSSKRPSKCSSTKRSLPAPLETRASKRRALAKVTEGGNNKYDNSLATCSTGKPKVWKSAPSRQHQLASVEEDSTTDEETGLITVHSSRQTFRGVSETRSPVRSRGLIAYRGVSKPPSYRSRQTGRSPSQQLERPSTANSIDILGGFDAFSRSEGADTMRFVAGHLDSEKAPAQGRGAAAVTASPVDAIGRLDEVLAAQDSQLQDLKIRLAKFEKIKRQQKEIEELNRQLEQYKEDRI